MVGSAGMLSHSTLTSAGIFKKLGGGGIINGEDLYASIGVVAVIRYSISTRNRLRASQAVGYITKMRYHNYRTAIVCCYNRIGIRSRDIPCALEHHITGAGRNHRSIGIHIDGYTGFIRNRGAKDIHRRRTTAKLRICSHITTDTLENR